MIEDDIQQVVADTGLLLNRLSGKTLLLTGASGYLAGYLADTITWLNDNVFSSRCTLLALVRSPVSPDGRLGHLLHREDVQFILQDVADPIYLDRRADFIVHAASDAAPKRYLAFPLKTMDANVVGTRQLLELAREHGVESFLFFSSCEIYGEAGSQLTTIPETYLGSVDSIGPRACYTESKRYGESLCAVFWREYTVPTKIVRPFHVYGPGLRLDDGRVVADFLSDRLANRPIRVLSDGSGVRAFTYISDATVGFWKVLLSDWNGEAFNIGNDKEPISMRDLALMIAGLEAPVLPVQFASSDTPEYLRGTPARVCPDIRKAKQRLGFDPHIDLQHGLRKTLDWFRTKPNALEQIGES